MIDSKLLESQTSLQEGSPEKMLPPLRNLPLFKTFSIRAGACLLFAFCLIALGGLGGTSDAVAQDIFNVPNPRKENRWVVDMTDSLSQKELDRVNSFCEELHQKTGAEMAVVMIKSTDGKRIEKYGVELFNHWGVGDQVSDNGLLMVVAKNDRKMRITLGDGIDVRQQERMAQRILDEEVTPRFRSGKFAEGLYAGARGTATRILGLKEKDFSAEFGPPPALPVNAFSGNPNNGGGKKQRWRPVHRNRGKGTPLPFMLVGGLVGLGGISIFGGRYYLRYRKRNCEICGDELVRLSEEQEDQFLSNPEQVEERIGSVDYDIWACLECEEAMKVRYGKFFTRYSTCPRCGYQTKYKIKRTLIHATTSHGGQVQVEEQCVNCEYYHEYVYSTPRRPKPSSSSIGSGGSSGGSFGGGGGGSFGGGSSSGGGATGSW